ncbi:MAG TPA: FTR1 family protein [Actinomycetota bacterium]|nr:FTR1 family protein [Actinomycetota bacterium]
MGAAFLITLREGIEAALLISIILAYLNAIGRRDRHGVVWAGVGGAVALSLLVGGIIFAIAGGLSHTASEVFEGLTSYLAVGVLTWMIFWMRRNAIRLKGELQERVDVALASGSTLALSALAFLVVGREGLETALFLFSAFKASADTPAGMTILGALLGLALAAGLGMLLYRGGLRLNLRTFFRVTGALILVVAASLLVYGTHELLEVGAFRFLDGTWLLAEAGAVAVPMNLILRVVVGLGGEATWLELSLWLVYLVVTGVLFFRPHRVAVARPATPERTDAVTG